MPPSKNLYIADADLPVWDRAVRLSKDQRESVSKIVVQALRHYLPTINTDIRVITDGVEALTATIGEDGRPILAFGRHDPHGIGWLLSYSAPGGGGGIELHFIPDQGHEPIDEARAHLRRVRGEEDPKAEADMEQITVEVGDDYSRTEGFFGRWLVEPDSDGTRTSEEGSDTGTYWGVALTKRGRIAVYAAHCNHRFPGRLVDYDDIDGAAGDLPEDILADAKAALGRQHVIMRDI